MILGQAEILENKNGRLKMFQRVDFMRSACKAGRKRRDGGGD
jgi:hypothetical protein